MLTRTAFALCLAGATPAFATVGDVPRRSLTQPCCSCEPIGKSDLMDRVRLDQLRDIKEHLQRIAVEELGVSDDV